MLEARVSLALRRAAGRPISEARLAADLRLAPPRLAAVLDELGRLGFTIESHPIQGLSLVGAPPALFEEEIACDLAVRRIGRRIRCVAEAVSTNDLAWAAADRGPAEADGLAIFAEHQSAGRGRRGNRWVAPPHSSLLVSVVAWVVDDPSHVAILTRAAAVAAAEAIESVTSLKVGIKWPNDLVIEDRKVGGILVEARPTAGGRGVAVIGMGLNCTQSADALPPEVQASAASLAMLGEVVDRTLLARALLERMDAVLALMETSEGQVGIRQAANARCRTLGRRITLSEGAATFTGEVVDLDPDYGLILRLAEGGLRRFHAMTSHVVA
jgi:BirA family transcriptional regulator, biotin operon repressor / biotin---[acetyl-CoA-carboxylase] ligase